jgi:hypothetical protein
MVDPPGIVKPKSVQVREFVFPSVVGGVLAETGKAPGVIQAITPPPMSAFSAASSTWVAIKV